MTRKSFFKSLFGIVGFGAVLGINSLVSNGPKKLNPNDEIRQLSKNYWIIRVDTFGMKSISQINEYSEILRKNGWHGVVMPKCDSFESFSELPDSVKQNILKQLAT